VFSVANFYMLRRNYGAAISRYKEVMTKYADYSKMPNTLYNLAEALKGAGNPEEAVIYYARVITEYPLSERVDAAKEQLTALKEPIPEPNPVALARAQQASHDDQGLLGKMIRMFKSRPAVPTETSAASDASEAGTSNDSAPAPVRGGTTASPAAGGTPANGGGTFTVDPKVDKTESAKKP